MTKILSMALLLTSSNLYSQEPVYSDLLDCTEVKWPDSKEYFTHLPQLPEVKDWMRAIGVVSENDVLQKSIHSATKWSKENGYLPCRFEMCATVMKNLSGGYTVHIDPKVQRFMGPDAIVAIDPESFEVIDSGRWHSGCVKK